VSLDGYRYGFQNQEKDDEIKGEGNSINYTFRMHDPRLGRFFAVDPLAPKYPYNSSYAFSENSTIAFIEVEGLEKALAELGRASNKGTGKLIICFSEDLAEVAKNSIKGSVFDYIYVDCIEDANKYLQEYMEEHGMENLDEVVFFAHGSYQGVKVPRKWAENEYHSDKDPIFTDRRVKSTDLKKLASGDKSTYVDEVVVTNFVNIAQKVKTDGVFVLLSCSIRQTDGEFGENLSEVTNSRFDIYINHDYSSTYRKGIFDIPLTSISNYDKGWFKYPKNDGKEQSLNSSIQIDGKTGEVKQIQPNY
jgi:RHS repeat-associated protein